MKNRSLKSAAHISASPNKYCNLLAPKMGKTWHFIFSKVDTLNKTFLLHQGHKKEDSNKITLSQEQ
jgi:hypothetical protein